MKIVRKHLRSAYDKESLIMRMGADILPTFVVKKREGTTEIILGSKNGIAIDVECKGSNSNLDRAIGQCLRYSLESKKPIYLAIPDDHKRLKTLQDIIAFFNLPIGLLIVGSERVAQIQAPHAV